MSSISGVMVLWNEEKLVDLAIKSCKDFIDELVVLDNGCTDRTMEVVDACTKKWSIETKIFKDASLNLTQARYFVFNKSKCDWILVCDGDHIWQTEGPHSLLRAKDLLGSRKAVHCFPLVRLYFDYHHLPIRVPVQPPHRLLYPNSKFVQGNRCPDGRMMDLPVSHYPRVNHDHWYCCWNLGIKEPGRLYRRLFWLEWRMSSDSMRGISLDDFICRKKNVNNVDQVVSEWVGKFPGILEKYDGKYGYPAVIQDEIDRGLNRSAVGGYCGPFLNGNKK